MGQLIQDLRLGARVLARKPGFALTAIVTLALGIGANAAIFSVVYGVLLHPLPYRSPERVVTLWETDTRRPAARLLVSPANFLWWHDRTGNVLESIGAVSPWAVEYTGGGEPESIDGALVSEGFFRALGVEAAIGRTFHPEEHLSGGAKVLVLADDLWRQKFGADPAIVGRTLPFGEQSYTVVGVLPPDVQAPVYTGRAYAPLAFWPGADRSRTQYLGVVGRLKPDVALRQAQAAIDVVGPADSFKDASAIGSTLVPVLDQVVGPVRPALWTLFGSALLILMIACANVAHLQLARGSERAREIAIRIALGAERARLVRQLVTENLWLVLGAGIGGALLAHWGIVAMRALAPATIPRLYMVRLGLPVFLFGTALALATLLLFSVVPALRASRPNVQPALKDGSAGASAGPGAHRLRDFLVVWEVALALVLLVGATLLTRSFVSLMRVEPGFRVENVASLQVYVYNRYPKPEQQVEYFRQAIEELGRLPDVESAGATSAQPFLYGGAPQSIAVTADGDPAPAPGQEATAAGVIVAGDYFRAAGIPLSRGRFFTEFDKADGKPVAIVSEAMARRLWGERDPVGSSFTVRGPSSAVRLEVVGVAGDVRRVGLAETPLASFYRPLAQSATGGMSFVVRTRSSVASRLAEVKQAIWKVNPKQPFYRVASVEDLVARSLIQRRFLLYLIGAFAGLALLLASVGIYGVISFVTAQRTREIGLRVALGATPGQIRGLVMGKGVALAAIGAVLGTLAALGVSRFVRSLLFGVSPLDPATYAAASAALLVLAASASYLPARRAMKADPISVLRQD